MNPDAQEFVPSWLTPPPSDLPQSPTQAQPPPQLPDETPDAWDDETEMETETETETVSLINTRDTSSMQTNSLDPPVDAMANVSLAEDHTSTLPKPVATEITISIPTPSQSEADNDDPASPSAPPPTPAPTAAFDSSSEEAAPQTQSLASPSASDVRVANAMNELTGGDEASSDLGKIEFDQKKPLNVVLLGHVDAGKSTISGHILVLTGNVDERTMEKFEKEAKALNRESWKFAFALDTSEQERAKGKTEECGQASFTTATRRFTILDAPGHKNYVPHMIGGASQADIGILVISARKGEFETGFERGGQTREHAMLAKTSGVRQMIIVINKLDDVSVINSDGTWSKDRFEDCKVKLEPYMKQVGWNPKGLVWIPVSGITGDNLKDRVSKKLCPWYDGESLLDTLDHIQIPDRLLTGAVKMPISEKHKEMGTMVMGKLESGVIQVNDKLTLMPNRDEVIVDALMLEGSTSQAAEPGDVVRLRLKGVEEEDVRVGFVLCSPNDLVSYSNSFTAILIILEHPSIICAGYSAVLHIHAAVEEMTIARLLAEVDKRTGKAKQKYPKFVKPGMKVLAQISTSMPICVEPYNVFPQLGRFMIRDEGKTVAVGTVAKVRPMEPEPSTIGVEASRVDSV